MPAQTGMVTLSNVQPDELRTIRRTATKKLVMRRSAVRFSSRALGFGTALFGHVSAVYLYSDSVHPTVEGSAAWSIRQANLIREDLRTFALG